jgi:uncharacterized protein (TIGR00730 family)
MKWITLFCGARLVKPEYKAVSDEFINWMCENDYGLVYGGGSTGIMGYVAKALLNKGLPVKGVIPESLMKLEVGLKECTELIQVNSMHERKQIMSDLGDAFVTLPGGFGTLDEICEIITWNQLSIINKPVSFLNSNNFFTPFKQFVEFASSEGFISTTDLKKVQWLNKMDEFKW